MKEGEYEKVVEALKRQVRPGEGT
ncbi:MAG: hypothetical protein OSP8Acid_06980 [uncultured Acidilobus sp. OSP8]|jgi:hypothetical protein|nr:MAG: hypothetical protein OSP8Acid_06980 [uncultured Acidilobus sp. OSP8]